MQICDCGAETTRITMTMTAGGRLLKKPTTICPQCRPEQFQEPFYEVTDRRIVAEHIARPYLYTQLPNGEFVAKDIVLSGIQDAMDADPDADRRQQLIERKRATRRTTPMTQAEIEAADRQWRPIVKQHYAEQDRIAREDRAYTDFIVEKAVRESHDQTIH